jgi:zinc transporter ZupT
MAQNKLIGLVLLVLAGCLIYMGFNQANSPMGELTEAFSGSYNDETMGYLIGGAVAAVIGLFLLLKK